MTPWIYHTALDFIISDITCAENPRNYTQDVGIGTLASEALKRRAPNQSTRRNFLINDIEPAGWSLRKRITMIWPRPITGKFI
jgi:hypothetical protein